MKTTIIIAVLILLSAVLFLLARRRSSPCPWWLSILLENPYMNAVSGSSTILDRIDLAPGMRVLDVGCGPGRLTIPAAKRVGPEGEVVALDLQLGMLRKLEKRIEEQGIKNIRTVQGGIGQGLVDHKAFDRALLITVLGEIQDREAAIEEIFEALKPGGILSITEVLPDPDYQTRNTVLRLAGSAGFRPDRSFGTWLAYTMNFVKPNPA